MEGCCSAGTGCCILHGSLQYPPKQHQHQPCWEQGCCGGVQSEPRLSAPHPVTVSGLCLCLTKLQVPPVVFCTFQAVVVSHSPCLFWGLGPGSVQQAQCPGTMLESPSATPSDKVAGG